MRPPATVSRRKLLLVSAWLAVGSLATVGCSNDGAPSVGEAPEAIGGSRPYGAGAYGKGPYG
jgi:hypothetical protein